MIHFIYCKEYYNGLFSDTGDDAMLNETLLNGTLWNETLLNDTMWNATLLNVTMLNDTLLNGTMWNETMTNGTTHDTTSDCAAGISQSNPHTGMLACNFEESIPNVPLQHGDRYDSIH